jgi:dolichyl-phosphate-mannose--protein O-mannosyl transferase
VYVHDSGELITASYVLGIAHPAGSPLYCMVGKLFQLIIPFGSIAFKMNALSALFAALSSVMLLVIIYKLTSDLIVSFFISLTFAFSGTFWSQALVAEVYTMATFTLLCSLYFLFDYLLNAETKKLYYFALLWGLLLTIHMEYSLMTPFIWLIIFINIKKADSLFKSVKKIAKITILFFIGLVPYLYLPIRSRANTVMDWGNPETLINFYYHITAKNVQKRMFTLGFGDYIYRMQDYLMIIIKDTLFIGIIGILLLIFDFKI